jgi:hypothetical protein
MRAYRGIERCRRNVDAVRACIRDRVYVQAGSAQCVGIAAASGADFKNASIPGA